MEEINNMIKCKACEADNHQDAAFCVYCGAALTEGEVQEKAVEEKEVKVQEEEIEAQAEKIEIQEKQVEVKKTKRASKLVIVSLVVALLGVGTGFTAYKLLTPGNQLTKTYKDNYELNHLLIMEYGESKDHNSAHLYFQAEGKEKQLIAKEVNFNSYVFAPKTNQVAYVDESSRLFLAKLGEEPVEITKQASGGWITFTSDEKYIFFCEEKEGTSSMYLYNIAEDSKQKLDDSLFPYMSRQYDETTKTLYFLDHDNTLYKYNQETGKEKIKKNVHQFKVLNDSLIMYEIYKQDESDYYIYDMQTEEEEKIKLDNIEIKTVMLSNDEKIVILQGQKDNDSEIMDLYIKAKEQEPVRFQKGILSYKYAADMNTLYYINEDNMLYSVVMPTFSKKALEDNELIETAIAEVEKNKIFSGAMSIQVSADGKKIGVKGEDGELNLVIAGEKLKVAEDVLEYSIFNNYIVYLNVDKELYVQKGIDVSDVSKITDKPEQIAKKVTDYYRATQYGKYVTYIEEENEKDSTYKMMRYSENGNIKVMLDNLDEYDAVTFNNMKHVRKLKYKDITGKYSCEGFEFVLELDENNNLSIYNTGVKKGDSKVSTYPLNTDEIGLVPESEQTVTINTYSEYESTSLITLNSDLVFTKSLNGTYTLRSNDGEYELQPMTDEAFEKEIQRQKAAEEERVRLEQERLRLEEERRQAEEAERERRYELDQLASRYYYDGVYLSAGTSIYDSHYYSSSSTYHTSASERWNVYDYYIDYELSVIWVQIMHRPGSGYTYEYGWIPMG